MTGETFAYCVVSGLLGGTFLHFAIGWAMDFWYDHARYWRYPWQ